MTSDPRGMVKTDRIELIQEWGSEYFHISSLVSSGDPGGDWPELVAFAKAILAADADWQDTDAPTIKELREKYPTREPCVFTGGCDEHFFVMLDKRPVMSGFGSKGEACKWLAAELAKRGEGE